MIEAARDYLHRLVYEEGFVFPMRLVFLGSDGSLMAGRYEMDDRGQDAIFSLVARYLPRGGLLTPVKVAYFDANDRGALMSLAPPHLTKTQ